MAYPHDPDHLEHLQDLLNDYEMFHELGLASDAELADFRARIERLRNKPPREWPEGTTIDEALEIAFREADEIEERELAAKREKAQQRGDLNGETHTQRTAAV